MTFEELLELASQADAAAAGTSAGGSGPLAAAPSAEVLADALPSGSNARRAAVAALGNEIHLRLLRNNVIPSSALLAAALLPEDLVGEIQEATSDVRTPCPPASSIPCALVALAL